MTLTEIPAFSAVVVKDALVSVSLGHRCKLVVPLLTKEAFLVLDLLIISK